MKRKRNLLVLCGVLAVICAGIFSVKTVEKHIDDIQTIDEVVVAIDKDALTQVSWTGEEGTVTLVKEDDTWKSADDEDFPVSQDAVDEFLSNFEEVKATFIIDDVEDYEQYGLKDPEHTITFTSEDGETVVTTGTYSTMDEQRYICVDGGLVYLIETDIAENLASVRDDFLDNDNIPYFYQVTNVNITTADNSLEIIYDDEGEYIYTNNYDYYLTDGDEYKAVATTNMNSLINTYTNFTFTDYVTYKATEEDLSSYGFDDPDVTLYIKGERYSEQTAALAETSYTEYDSDTIEDAEYTLYFVKKDDETVYLHVQDSPIVYNFDVETFESLSSMTYDDLRPSQVISIEEENLKTIAATVDGEEYVVTIETDDDGNQTYTVDEKEADAATVLDDIEALSITEFNSETPSDVVEFEFTVTLPDDTKLTVKLYRVDDENCLATFNGETLGYLTRSSVTSLKEDFTKLLLSAEKAEQEESSEN